MLIYLLETINKICYNNINLLKYAQRRFRGNKKMRMNGDLSEKFDMNIKEELMQMKNDTGILCAYCEKDYPLYHINDKMLELLGYESEDEFRENIGGMVGKIVHPDDLAQVTKDYGEIFFEGKKYETACRLLRKDKSWFWAENKGSIVTDEDGDLVIVCVCRDMTSFVSRMEKLERENFFNENLMNKLPGGYIRCLADEELTFCYTSECFLNIIGWTAEEIRSQFGNSFMELVHPDDRAGLIEYADEVRSAEHCDRYKDHIYRLKGKNGYRWITDISVRTDAGGKTFYQCMISDITEYIEDKEKREKRLKQALDSANLKTEVISAVSSLFLQTYVVDLDVKKYDKVTTEGVKYGTLERGGTLEEMANIGINILTSEEYRGAMTEFLDFSTLPERLKHKQTISIDMKGFNGRWYSVFFIVQKRKENGEISRVLYVTSDINERKIKEIQYENKLMQSLQEVKRADLAKTDFLRRMSHDIRTPINGIRGMLEIAERFPNDLERQAECRRKVDEASSFLLSLVNSVLDMNKLESGKVIIEHKPFDLIDLLNNASTIVESNAIENGIEYHIDRSRTSILHRKVIGSPVHLQQILLNMASNAVKYNRENGKVFVYTEEFPRDNNSSVYRFVCSDTGIGMSEEFIKHAFEPFAQEERSSNTAFGSGLGLSIVKELVERMDGTIKLESKLNEGTRFTVDIPLEFDKSAKKEDNPCGCAEKIDLRGKKALVVEDNELNMEIAEFILEQEGLIVDKASNGLEGAEKFERSQKGEYDIIFMDVMMPVMNGLDAAHRIRTSSHPDAKTVPIIAMSANVFQDDIERGAKAGMNAYITKPIDIKKVKETICSVLKNMR